jgi:hypothetical protein
VLDGGESRGFDDGGRHGEARGRVAWRDDFTWVR